MRVLPSFHHLLLTLLLLTPGLAAAAAPLTDFAGKPQQIDDYAGHGKWLVVMFWASDCPVCNAEVHQYNDFHTFHQDSDATVLGISLDGAGKLAEAKAFVARHEVGFPNLIGEPEAVSALYGALVGRPLEGTPAFLIYDPAGKLVAARVGAVPANRIEEFISR